MTVDYETLGSDQTIAHSTTATWLTTNSLSVGKWLIAVTGLMEYDASATGFSTIGIIDGSATATFDGPQEIVLPLPVGTGPVPFAITFLANVTAPGTLALQASTDTGSNDGITVLSNAGVSSGYAAVLLEGAADQKYTKTYSISGTLGVPSGATNFLPPFFESVDTYQTVSLVGVWGMVRAGTATLDIQQNGTNVATSIGLTTSPSYTAIGVSVADGDYFAPVLTAVSSSDGLSLSFVYETTS
jgi:hypothetical protein